MPTLRLTRPAVFCTALTAATLLTTPGHAQDADGFEPTGPWTRMVSADEDRYRLDIATRFFVPIDGEGPTIALVGAVHIGDALYYEALQGFLDAQDLVLFEGVGGPGEAGIEPGSDADKARRTDRRLQFLVAMVGRYTDHTGSPPAGLDALLSAEEDVFDAVLQRKLAVASEDAWGSGLSVVSEDGRGIVSITSFGADGQTGGEGVDADQTVEIDPEAEHTPAVYDTIAAALGFASQGERMLTDQPSWVNSDMSWDEVAAALDESDPQTRAMLEGLLNGEDPMIAMALQGMEQFLSASPMMRTMVKVMLVRTLGDDNPMAQAGTALGEGFETVIIDLRNQAVVDDLLALQAEGTEARSIAVFYGAGHMADLEERMYQQLGYHAVGGFWLPAVTLDLNREGLSDRERDLLRRQLAQ